MELRNYKEEAYYVIQWEFPFKSVGPINYLPSHMMISPVLLVITLSLLQSTPTTSAARVLPGVMKWNLSNLAARQVSVFPPDCEMTCQPVTPFVGPTATMQCTEETCCTSAFVMSYFNCFICAGQEANFTAANYQLYQTILDELTADCHAFGKDVPKQTFPGQDPNRPIPTVVVDDGMLTTLSGGDGGNSASSTAAATASGAMMPTQVTISILPSLTPGPNVQTTITALPSSAMPNSEVRIGCTTGEALMPALLLGVGGWLIRHWA
ncbi:hypothetical protein AMATHDRAFT_3856 [Amanita thiersii Skay4041]|uniref:Uncharacterized protein n=1 Tax=Amanita thiersii Skay4041 TaxID=703135 RepID=A0A2A9NMM9_9AGAR|nr:hypothetical protein AMATHDRAFT_3856 [Amanita thiersii Skay4041]